MLKNWQGGGELLPKNGTILRLLTMLFSVRIYIARGPLALWEFSQQLPANIAEDQKKFYHVRPEPLGLCHM